MVKSRRKRGTRAAQPLEPRERALLAHAGETALADGTGDQKPRVPGRTRAFPMLRAYPSGTPILRMIS
jgi:hypothetical protein